jgi:tetratricopeptide (TPR) repeat protein
MRTYKLFNNLLGWVAFIVASTVYLLTIEPSASFWDCGEFVSSAFKLEVGHPPGAPFFMLTANLFTQLASDPTQVPVMVNAMSALFSGLTILFLFWTITHLARKVIVKEGTSLNAAQMITILGSGMVGALAYTFSDTFWFSAVEGEVYAFSSLFTALVFWLILKWEDVADQPHADRWIILIAYLMGLSIGVHLLNLLCIPAMVLVYYYKKFPNPNMKGTLLALAVSFAIVGIMMYGVVQGLVEVCGLFELLFVNVFGCPYNTGVFAYIIILSGLLIWSIYETMQADVNALRLKISFILTVIALGIPFIGSGYALGILLIIILAVVMFKMPRVNVKLFSTILFSLLVIVVGYSSYALILIRSTADTPMNQNAPKDIFTLRAYLAREQYGQTPLFYGNTFVSEIKYKPEGKRLVAQYTDGEPVWNRIIKKSETEKDKYIVTNHSREPKYVSELNTIFPRMYSQTDNHKAGYHNWSGYKGTPVKYDNGNGIQTAMKPTFAENLTYFFRYQLNFMYWRYFMWNFSGRQNDIQGDGDILNGNWISGIKFIDEPRLGPSDNLPYDMEHNKGHNVYYMLPLLLGIIGLLYQAYSGAKGIQSFWITFFLFFMTGIAIVLYLNQTPAQPRERDYAYAGSFYAFAIWIGLGVAGLSKALERYAKAPGIVASVVASILCLFVPFQMAGQSWDDHDRSGRYLARDFGSNYLESCEPDAIIFTNGDNDTFPLWYAQEVEGIRTDVRVCNTSYLQTDWYANQMKRQAYSSSPLPISWPQETYVQGTRDYAYIFPLIDKPVELGWAMDFIRSDDERTKRVQGIDQNVDYIPSKTLTFKVDSATVVGNGTLSPKYEPFMLKEMSINLDGKNALGKQELFIYDMLRTNNWKRPMYYAITVQPDQFARLDGFFQQTGLAFQIVPMNAKDTPNAVNTEKMYDNLMNKFKWGGIDNINPDTNPIRRMFKNNNLPSIYLDENSMRMCKSYRMNLFTQLARMLMQEGENEKALKVLDRCMEVLPAATIPMDGTAWYIGEFYYRLGEKEKAEQVFTEMAKVAHQNLQWYYRLKPQMLKTIHPTVESNMYIMQELLRLGEEMQAGYVEQYKKTFEDYMRLYRVAFASAQQQGRN